MPHIEVLPNTSGHAAPGWAYVADTGYDPSKAAINPSARKRTAARNAPYASQGDLTARQQTAITRHLAELDKDNHKDVQVPVPQRQRDGGSRGSRKMTPAVRKIIQSQKTFANHLSDEEAFLKAQSAMPSSSALATPASLLRHESSRTTKTPATKLKRQSTASTPLETESSPAPVARHPLSSSSGPATLNPSLPTPGASLPADPDEHNPLFSVNVPRPPSPGTIERLISAPPLSYNAAQVAPSTSSAPRRRFCEICGYWGRVKCMKCGVYDFTLDRNASTNFQKIAPAIYQAGADSYELMPTGIA